MVFQPEDTERSIHIKIINDDIVESDEQFLLQLSTNEDEHVCLKQSTTATINILDDDSMQLIIADSGIFAEQMHRTTTTIRV